ncbi:MAG: glycosyl hydrolase family 95 catalytic domain-containing protein [Opitutaceae bacterium]
MRRLKHQHIAQVFAYSFILLALLCPARLAASQTIDQVDWQSFLSEQDMVWNHLPKNWKEAPFLGNGEMGSMIYQIDKQTLRWDVGCSAVHDHRPFEDDDFKEKNVVVLNRGRHFIGHLQVKFPEDLTGGSARLNLWDAIATGTVESAGGNAEWTSLVHAEQPVLYIELEAEGALQDVAIHYIPEEARSPRAVRAKVPREPANPPPIVSELPDGVQLAVHNLHAGGQTAVAWKQVRKGKSLRLLLSVQHSYPSQDAQDQAVEAVRTAVTTREQQWLAMHRDWWHNYYPQSFISTGESYWDSFYWAQQYKLASATRDKGWIMDNQGPWLQPTAWNACWWNLNVQVAHSGITTANRRGMGSALSHRLDINRDNLALNVAEPYRADSYAIGRSTSGWDLLGHAGQPGAGRPPMDPKIGRECGNLLWALHNVDMEYRYWLDTDLRDRVLYPLLVRAVNYYRHFLKVEADGYLHLPETYSPEYRRARDCTYDIDLLRWANERLLQLAAEKGLRLEDEPLIKEWQKIRETLTPVHVNETGRMIGKNVALTSPHRHWSHLLAIYPLRTLTPETEEDRALILRSLDQWHSFKRPGAGYSVTGGACMAALLGDGERAYNFINRLKSFLHTNTFYSEAGGLPVIETPLHGATAIQEMLLQSWGGRLRIFPAVPAAWADAQFHQLRGEGAFLVSARREQQQTQWVYIQAEAGGAVEVTPQIPDAQWIASGNAQVSALENGVYQIETAPGEKVLFWPKGTPRPNLAVTPVTQRDQPHRFGKP